MKKYQIIYADPGDKQKLLMLEMVAAQKKKAPKNQRTGL